jgi:hypothetical protein
MSIIICKLAPYPTDNESPFPGGKARPGREAVMCRSQEREGARDIKFGLLFSQKKIYIANNNCNNLRTGQIMPKTCRKMEFKQHDRHSIMVESVVETSL